MRGAATLAALPFSQIVFEDFEFQNLDGERPDVACYVAHELRSGVTTKLWRDQLRDKPPYPCGANTLHIGYAFNAEAKCYRALGWPIPERVIDLFAEFRDQTNVVLPKGSTKRKNGLLDALAHFDLDHIDAEEKDRMRQLFIDRGPRGWTEYEKQVGMDYCESDVIALVPLLTAMLPRMELFYAMLRGRYMATAVSAMEFNGIPIDVEIFEVLKRRWPDIQTKLIRDIDQGYNLYDENLSFKEDRFEDYLNQQDIPWPRHASGRLKLDDDTFKDVSLSYLQIKNVREMRKTKNTNISALPVGKDGRNRTSLFPFSSSTGRNQPSGNGFIFCASKWLRSLIKPEPGWGVAYIDWKTAEVGIAAALSGDGVMMADYMSGDTYLALGIAAGVMPAGATKDSHPDLRDMMKPCGLGLLYGMGPGTLATRLGKHATYPNLQAQNIWAMHHRRYLKFWEWTRRNLNHAMLQGYLRTTLGFHAFLGEGSNPLSLCNFPVQGNCAEMLRVACCLAIDKGVQVAAPVHDAVLIYAPLDRLDADVATMKACMAEASRTLLGGFELGTDDNIVRYPERFRDKGQETWERVTRLAGIGHVS